MRRIELGGLILAAAEIASACQGNATGSTGIELIKGDAIADCYSNDAPFTEQIIEYGQQEVHVRFSSTTKCEFVRGASGADMVNMGITSPTMDSLDTTVDRVVVIPGR